MEGAPQDGSADDSTPSNNDAAPAETHMDVPVAHADNDDAMKRKANRADILRPRLQLERDVESLNCPVNPEDVTSHPEGNSGVKYADAAVAVLALTDDDVALAAPVHPVDGDQLQDGLSHTQEGVVTM